MANVLVVDDDPNFRRLVSVTLGAAGHTVLDAGRCGAAANALKSHKLDLLIVDGLLPDGDGVAWVKGQRASGMKVPVLFISAFRKTAREQQTLASNAGIDDVLAKPVTAPELLAKVERVLKKHGFESEELVLLGDEELRALEEMRAQYAAALPGVIAALQASVTELAANPGDAVLQGLARRRAHQLAGTAGSFGYAPLGDACAGLEQAILALRAGGPLQPVQAALRALVLADFPDLA